MKNFIFALLCATFMVRQTTAATFCVDTADELTTALSTAQNNAEDDDIRIHTGTYTAPVGGWEMTLADDKNLTIAGGYTDVACQNQTQDASLTALDGGNAVRPLTINAASGPLPDTYITVRDLTFRNGQADLVGGLKISDPVPIYGGNILVERNIFLNNISIPSNSGGNAGGLLAATDGPHGQPGPNCGTGMTIRNNLFIGNRAGYNAAALVFSNCRIEVSNNTFFDNQSTDGTAQKRVALEFFTLTQIDFINNIFWGNTNDPDTYDLDFAGIALPATLINNNIQASTGTAASNVGTLNVDPQFVDIAGGNFRLAATSPLINAGINDPAGGTSMVDLDGAPRTVGTAIDLGAYEYQAVDANLVFKNGFE